MNVATARAIAEKCGWPSAPSVIQMRIRGAKGLLVRHPSDTSSEPIMWLRDSQIKIKIPNPDASQLTLDLVRPPRFTYPARVSAETIINMSHNGVPHTVFVNLMRDGLKTEISSLITWDGPCAMQRLYAAVSNTQGVIGSRMRLHMGAASRARGFGEALEGEVLDEDGEEDECETDEPIAWAPDNVSGLPSSLAETVLSYLAAGFKPDTCPILMEKLKMIIKQTVAAYVQRYRLAVPCSCDAFVVPGMSCHVNCVRWR
jgi:RNA-dependent RNA polymerase